MAERNPRAALALPLVTLPLAAMLAGCGGDRPSPPGAQTVGETRALDDAAQMLDQRRAPLTEAATLAPAGAPADHARS